MIQLLIKIIIIKIIIVTVFDYLEIDDAKLECVLRTVKQ